jgi:spore cortex formation protein SpoVR/YcgB (stage V sporulation)
MYDDMRAAESPETELLRFLESTYETAAELAHWDRESLERRHGHNDAMHAS